MGEGDVKWGHLSSRAASAGCWVSNRYLLRRKRPGFDDTSLCDHQFAFATHRPGKPKGSYISAAAGASEH